MKQINRYISLSMVCLLLITGCQAVEKKTDPVEEKPVELVVAAAASLQYSMEELQELYEKENKNVKITFSFASSGALQKQIENGAPMDVFLSASLKQMDELEQKEMLIKDTKKELLENKVVVIVPKGSELKITVFEDILKAKIIAIGDPESVPVGQYSEEIFEKLGIWEQVKEKATYGTDVSQVLSWVSSGNAEAGVVYQTDALTTTEVQVAAYAVEGSCSKVIYPVAVVKKTKQEQASREFVAWLAKEEASAVFGKYGFMKCE